jgi:hypothetical protein
VFYSLKNKLQLPPITLEPPLPKRSYEKLLAQFQTQLTPTTTRSNAAAAAPPSTPPARPRRTAAVAAAAALKEPEAPAPAPEPESAGSTVESRSYLTNEITALCARLDVPAALPHMLTGVKAVLDDPENAAVRGKTVYAVAIAVAILVIERLAPIGEDVDMPVGNIRWQRGAGYKKKQTEVMQAIEDVVDMKTVARGLGRGHVDDFVKKMSLAGYRKWAWMSHIPNGVGAGCSGKGRIAVPPIGKPKETETRKRKAEAPPPAPEKPEPRSKKAKISASTEAAIPEPKPQPVSQPKPKTKSQTKPRARAIAKKPADHGGGGGKMLQERVDYLSEKKMMGFELFKKTVLEECDAIEACG